MDFIEVIRKLLEMGWPGVVLLMIYVLWMSYDKRTQAYIDYLEKDIEKKDRMLAEKIIQLPD